MTSVKRRTIALTLPIRAETRTVWEVAMTTHEIIERLSGRLSEVRRTFSVQRLALFGSAARDEAGQASDIDVLVVFQGTPTFDAFMDLKFYLEDLLGKPVDLVTDKALRPQVRCAIETELIDVA